MKRASRILIAALPGLALLSCASLVARAENGGPRRTSVFLYSESTVRSRDRLAINESKLQFAFFRYASHLEFYAGASTSQTYELERGASAPGNSVALYPGIRLRLPVLPITLYGEYRQLFLTHPGPRVDPRPRDLRLGAVGYDWRDLARLSSARLFVETYADLTYSGRLNQDLFLQGWLKAGPRLTIARALFLDPYLEGVLKRSRNRLPGDQADELRAGLRLAAQFGPVGAFALGSRDFEDGGWNGLFAIVGNF